MAKSNRSKKKSLLNAHIGEALQQQSFTEDNIKQNLTLKDELKDYIPPLHIDEFRQLEQNILQEGCRDALVVWDKQPEFILIDGHNRHAICQKHKLDFKIELKKFRNIDQVKEWMIINQLGKRNLTEMAKAYLRGEQYLIEKKNKTDNLKQNTKTPKGQNDPSISTAKKLAETHKVSESTIKRDQQYAAGLNKLAGKDNQLKWKILNKELDIPKNIVVELTNKPDREIRSFKNTLLKTDPRQAIRSLKKEKNIPSEQKPGEKTKPSPILKIRTDIVHALDQLLKNKDKKNLAELKGLIDSLEKTLFS